MLMPKRTKWRRPHRRKLGGEAHKGTKVSYGEAGPQALDHQPSNRSCSYCDDTLYQAWW